MLNKKYIINKALFILPSWLVCTFSTQALGEHLLRDGIVRRINESLLFNCTNIYYTLCTSVIIPAMFDSYKF